MAANETDLVMLVSLLEGAVTIEEARSALQQAKGSMDIAVQLLFAKRSSGGAANPVPASSFQIPVTPRIDLEYDALDIALDSPVLPPPPPPPPPAARPPRVAPYQPAPSFSYGSSSSSSSTLCFGGAAATPAGEVGFAGSTSSLDFPGHGVAASASASGVTAAAGAGAAAGVAGGEAATGSQAAGGGMATMSNLRERLLGVGELPKAPAKSPILQPKSKAKAAAKEEREAKRAKKQDINKDWVEKEAQGSEWQTIQASYLEVGGLVWVRGILEVDPPCLSLGGAGHSDSNAALVSTGEMHHGGVASDRTVKSVHVNTDVTRWGTPTKVRGITIRNLFTDLLSRVRYPPDNMTLSWRLTDVPPAQSPGDKSVPPELAGPIPHPRPFALCCNGQDPEAPQPPNFGQHRLRPEQLRSLSWMLAREGHDDAAAGERAGGNNSGYMMTEWRSYFPVDDPTRKLMKDRPTQLVVGARVKLSEAGGHATGQSNRLGTILEKRGVGIPLVQWDDDIRTSHVQEVLEFVDTGVIAIGSLVRVKPSVKHPEYGWGGLTHNDVGVVTSINVSSDVVGACFSKHPTWKGKLTELERVTGTSSQAPPQVLEARAQASYVRRGGILADKIGYGKTATTIALIDSTLHKPPPEIPEIDHGSFFPARGTLIIVPSNLLDQWLGEIGKFAWAGNTYRGRLKNGWSPQDSPLKIFAMSSVSPLKTAKARDIARADVVICTYRLLFSTIYQTRRDVLASGVSPPDIALGEAAIQRRAKLSSLVKQTEQLIKGRIQMASGVGKNSKVAREWGELEFPVLEQFHWKRVVFDEFHELESFDSLQQNSLQHLRASYRWGLTGTPPVESVAGVIFMSSLFRIDLPGHIPGANLKLWESDRLMNDMAVEFLDTYVRQNTAELPHIRLEERIIVVRHTPEERALYLGQAHDAPDLASEDAFASDESKKALEKLLKLCSHFQSAGNDSSNAKAECHRIGEQKERRLARARNQLARCSRVIFLLTRRWALFPDAGDDWREELRAAETKVAGDGVLGAKMAAELVTVTQEANREPRFETLEVLSGHKPKDEELAALLVPPAARQNADKFTMAAWEGLERSDALGDQPTLRRLLKAQAAEQTANLRELFDAASSLEFFRTTVAALARNDAAEDRSCSVCMDEDIPLDRLAITPCAHIFCTECLRTTVAKFHACSLCRRKLTPKDIVPLAAELNTGKAEAPPPSDAASSKSGTPKYGTKLESLVQHLKDLRREDTTAKVILFVQFDDLKRKVADALEDSGVPTVLLHGTTSMRSNIVRDWQENSSSRQFVLLLSLAQSASGTNLTAASHVVFLHPMLAPTAERAVGHEVQAIGRARRHGQLRDVVHVWRFVTAGTVEQGITERHQSALWEREQAREQAQAAAQGQAAAEGAEEPPQADAEGAEELAEAELPQPAAPAAAG